MLRPRLPKFPLDLFSRSKNVPRFHRIGLFPLNLWQIIIWDKTDFNKYAVKFKFSSFIDS